MRAFVSLALVVCLGVAVADEAKKPRTYKRADLGKSLKAKAGDVIVIVEDVKPKDIEDLSVSVDGRGVSVSTEAKGNEIRVKIEAGSGKGKATVSWKYTTADGKVGGHDGLEIQVE